MQDSKNPLVSIIMPTYNRANMISLAINSILEQSYTNWELLVIDNESTDNTKEIVEKFSKEDSRIFYYNVKKDHKIGIASYLNYGIDISSGEYIARLDDDDEWCCTDKLKKQVSFLEQNEDYVIVGGGAKMVDGNRREIFKFFKRETDYEIRNHALYANPFWHNTVLFRRDSAIKVGGYKKIKFVEDWDLWLRLGQIGKLYNFKEYFSLYMNAGQNRSTENQKLTAQIILQYIKTYRNDYPNYRRAYIINFMQYLFSFLPAFIKKRIQNFLFFIKRNYF
jgi:glycosyltransferase involved in cell wall biosynthesis